MKETEVVFSTRRTLAGRRKRPQSAFFGTKPRTRAPSLDRCRLPQQSAAGRRALARRPANGYETGMTNPSDALLPTGLDPDARRVDDLAREILRDGYRSFEVERLEVVEENRVAVRARLRSSAGDVTQEIVGEGVGLVDAFFDGMLKAWAEEFPSLKTISIADFAIGSGFDGTRGRRSDALAVARLQVVNSHGVTFSFEQRTPSVTRSCIRVALDAVMFFVNSERAYVQLQVAMKDAKERRRSDLVARYRDQMGVLVQATSYSEVIERLRESGGE
jgi:hypothetical protein